MGDVPANVTMENLIDQLYRLIVGDANSKVRVESGDISKVTSIQMLQPGIPIQAKDFANMRTEFNPQGDLRPTEAFSKWVDRIPDVVILRFKPSSNLVSTAYGTIVESANSNASEPSQEEKDAYDKASKFLYAPVVNPFTGKVDEGSINEATPVYKDYKEKKKKYDRAIEDYVNRWSELDLNKIEDQKKWQAEGRKLQNAIDDAWDDWIAAKKTYVEMALDITGTKMRTLVAKAINDAQKLYDACKIPSLMGTSYFWPAYTFPHSWWEPDSSGWTKITVKSSYDYLHTESHVKKMNMSGLFLGIFSIGGKGGWAENTSKETAVSNNIEISFSVATIDIIRPWLSTTWMLCQNWFERDEKKGRISSGDLGQLKNDMLLPLIPMQVIVARDIILTGHWSKETKDYIQSQINADMGIGYGPFCLHAKYEQSDTGDTQTSQFEGNSLKVDGMQIIGMVSSCAPLSPPIDDPNLKK